MNKRQMILPQVFLTCVQSDKFKMGTMSLSMLQPLQAETAGANALIPSVLLRGCVGNPDMASISSYLEENYGGTLGTLVRKKGEIQAAGFYMDFLEERFALDGEPVLANIVDLLGRVLLQPILEDGVFVKQYVDGEKQILLNAIDSSINDKQGYANAQMLQRMFQGETFGVPRLGDRPTVEKLDVQGVYQQYLHLITHSQIEIFYTGSMEEQQVKALLLDALQSLPRGEIVPVEATGTVRPKDGTVEEHRETMNITQGKLSMGLRMGITAKDPEYPAALLMNAIFGAGVTSKLFEHVREELSLCYYASSAMEKFKGIMIIGSGIAFDKYEVAKTEIMKQLEACANGDISDFELESARTHILSSLKTGMDSPGRLDDYAFGQVVLGKEGTMADLAVEVAAVTKEQVVAAAAKVHLDTVYFLEGDSHETV